MSAGSFGMRTEGHIVLREKGLVRTQTFGIQINVHSSDEFISSVPPFHESEIVDVEQTHPPKMNMYRFLTTSAR